MYLAPRSTFTSFAQRYPHVKPPRNPHPIYSVQKDAPNQCIQISQTTLPLTRIEIERDRKNVASFSSILKETPTPRGTHKETLCSDKPNMENKAKQKSKKSEATRKRVIVETESNRKRRGTSNQISLVFVRGQLLLWYLVVPFAFRVRVVALLISAAALRIL